MDGCRSRNALPDGVVDPGNTVDEVWREKTLPATRSSCTMRRPQSCTAKSRVCNIDRGPGYEGKNAVDGNRSTRWSSGFSDPQVLVIDLGYNYRVDMIDLYWETAYATEYAIRIAEDGGTGATWS